MLPSAIVTCTSKSSTLLFKFLANIAHGTLMSSALAGSTMFINPRRIGESGTLQISWTPKITTTIALMTQTPIEDSSNRCCSERRLTGLPGS